MIMQRRFPNIESRLRGLALVGAGVVILGVVLFNNTLFHLLSSFIVSLTLPNEKVYELMPKNVLAARLIDAEQELSRIRAQAVLYADVAREVERLENLLLLAPTQTIATGRVVARPPRTLYDTLLVSLPRGHQVMVGDRALFEGVLLGDVEKVSQETVLVSLYSSPRSQFDARVGSPSATVAVSGVGGGSFIFEVPSEVALVPGDTVVSSFDDTTLIAVVSGVVSRPDTTVQTVYARTPISFSDIRYLSFVHTNSDGL